MKKTLASFNILLPILLFFLVACSASGEPGPVSAIETYIKSLVEKDLNQLINASCAAWEDSARQELRTFDAVTVSLEGLQCKETIRQEGNAQIDCSGKIVANYGNEVIELNLADRSYLAINEGGDWRMCGYR